MSTIVLSKCPGCKKIVRVPEEWAEKTVRCKFCGMVCMAKPSAALAARMAEAKAPPKTERAPAIPKPEAIAPLPRPTPAPTAIVPHAPVLVAPTNGHGVPSANAGNPWNAFTNLDAPAPTTGKRYRRRRSFAPMVVALLFFSLCLGGAFAAWKYQDRIRELVAKHDVKNRKTDDELTTAATNASRADDIPTVKGKFPRRMLGISVNSYLYCNPTTYGHDSKSREKTNRDFGAVLERLANKLHIDASQVYELSDSSTRIKPNPPLKPVIEQTISRFVDTCRPQDNIILIFSGHAAEVKEKPYLVPLEGDLEDEASLIPLQWLLDQLARCAAQQKILIMDVCRYDPARGFERASGGKMSPKVESMLKSPPPGVQVLSACAADQYSYEIDDFAQVESFALKGGVFLNMFFYTLGQGIAIQKEADPIPIESMAAKVNADTTRTVQSLFKDNQTPFLAGTMRQERVSYDPEEALAQRVDIATPASVFGGNLLASSEIEKLMAEIDMPPIKQARVSDAVVKFSAVVPFSADAMKDYMDDGASFDEIKKSADKYPLRFAVVKAIEDMRKLKEAESGETELPDKISQAEINDSTKNALVRVQRGPARVMLVLRQSLELLEKIGEDRKDEKSKRWQAHYDYVTAMVKAKLAYVHEYSLMAGRIRKEDLPEVDKKLGQDGWRLASQVGLQSPTEIKDMVKDANKLFRKLATDHKGTPWEVLAKRERQTALGLKWVPTGLGGDVTVK